MVNSRAPRTAPRREPPTDVVEPLLCRVALAVAADHKAVVACLAARPLEQE